MKELHHIMVEETKILVEVIRERRRSVRFSVVKNGVNMRIPFILTNEQVLAQLENVKIWLAGLNKKKDNFLEKFEPKSYKTGDILTVGNRQYFLDIYVEDKKSHSARLKNNVITLNLSKHDNETHRTKSIAQLLSRVVGNDFLPFVTRRVQELNHLYFRKVIKEVRLKYNHTNWGSCSTNGIINLSTRLLFAPDDVIDYVIIHELSHLVEMNHSDRFWKVVETAMPDYREKEKWLSKNGSTCNF
jgi:predicted metal-dependent hydrolase